MLQTVAVFCVNVTSGNWILLIVKSSEILFKQGVFPITETLITTTSLSTAGIYSGVAIFALERIPVPLTISHTIVPASWSVKVAVNCLFSPSQKTALFPERSIVGFLVIFTRIVSISASVQGPIGVASAVKIENPLAISVALGVKRGSKSLVFPTAIVPGEEADHRMLSTLVKSVMVTCPGITWYTSSSQIETIVGLITNVGFFTIVCVTVATELAEQGEVAVPFRVNCTCPFEISVAPGS